MQDTAEGFGMPVRQVFEPFFRLEGSRNRNSGGVGLGMTIAREAVERLGGHLSLEDTPGGGLTAATRTSSSTKPLPPNTRRR